MTDQSKYETVFLGGLPDCSREEIINLCGSTGRIASTRVRRGYAFIDYFNPADADFGIKYLHGIKFKGKKITAEFAHRLHTPTRSHSTTTMALPVISQWFVINVEPKDTGQVNALKISEPRRAFVVGLQATTLDTVHVDPSLPIAARDPEITRLVPEAATTTKDIMVPKLAFPDPGLAKTMTATTTMTPWINPKLILLPILASNSTMRGDDTMTILRPGLPLLMMIPIQYHYIRRFHRILNMFQVGSMNVDRESAHSRGYTRSKGDSAQGHRSQTNSGRQKSDPDSASDVDRYTGNYHEERTTTAHRYHSRSSSPGLQAPRRNAISGDHESYYSRDFFEASVPQSAYHY
ncbi:hypothetical protein F5051DRAFT_500195 [Lentinula edodes]|nr:hypothetical protein F5051DRAFT_500195 [Lentinula edodes]